MDTRELISAELEDVATYLDTKDDAGSLPQRVRDAIEMLQSRALFPDSRLEDGRVELTEPARMGAAFMHLANEEQEHLAILVLDNKLKTLAFEVIHKGALNFVHADTRTILRAVLKHNADGFAIGHNHPSGDPTPSAADCEFTRDLKEASKQVGLRMHDSIVVARDGYASLYERGLMRV